MKKNVRLFKWIKNVRKQENNYIFYIIKLYNANINE